MSTCIWKELHDALVGAKATDNPWQYEPSFQLSQSTDIKAFFDEHGFVVIDDVLTEGEVMVTVDEVQRIINEKREKGVKGKEGKESKEDFKVLDTTTHHLFPGTNRFAVLNSGPLFTTRFLENRQNARVAEAFAILYEHKPFVVTHDSGCLYRPSADHPEYRTPDEWPHLDLHPDAYHKLKEVKEKRDSLTYNQPADFLAENNLICEEDGLQLAALINLWPNRVEDGGFCCTPGFPKESFDEWTVTRKSDGLTRFGLYQFEKAKKDDAKAISKHVCRRIAARAGSLIVWDQRMPHGSKPNFGADRCRIAQFIKAIPLSTLSMERRKHRREALKKVLKTVRGFTTTPTGKQVFDM